MKIVVRNTSKRPWDKAESGVGEVIEACCEGIPVGTSFAVERRDVANGSALYAYLKQEYDDAAEVPFGFCPCCGATVEVTEWEAEREYGLAAVISSGEHMVDFYTRWMTPLPTLPPTCLWSGQAVTYGTLPNDGREGGPA